MKTAITGALVHTGETFAPLTVHVDGDTVAGVDTAPPGPDETTVDATGLYVVPGLIDAHYHLVSRSSEHPTDQDLTESILEGVRNAEDTLASGVTTVRDCGCRTIAIYTLQAGIRGGMACGPASVTAGRNPTGSAAPAHWRNVVADGPEGMRAAVRSQVEAGAGWVKLILAHAESPTAWDQVTVFMSDDEIAAAVDEAHALGVAVGAHCEGWEVAERAVRLGLDSLDHAPLLSEAAVAGMAARAMTYTPTLWAFSDDSGIDLDALPGTERDSVLAWREEHRASVRRALAAGVPIAAGSDSASTLTGEGVLANELVALVGAGLSPAQALRAATATGAALLGRGDRLGRIDAGYQADLVALTADPLTDIGSVRSPAWVRQGGELRYAADRGIVPVRPATGEAAGDAVVARW
jgi:imidazolonepropionase-like amidohydrolase